MHDKKPFGRTVAAIKTVKQLLATSSGGHGKEPFGRTAVVKKSEL